MRSLRPGSPSSRRSSSPARPRPAATQLRGQQALRAAASLPSRLAARSEPGARRASPTRPRLLPVRSGRVAAHSARSDPSLRRAAQTQRALVARPAALTFSAVAAVRRRALPLRAVAESLRARHAQPVPMPPVAGALQARPSPVQISELPRAQHPVPDRPSPPWLAMVTEQPSRPRRCPCSPPRPFVYLHRASLLLPSASRTRQVSRAQFRT
jgi:hypothetical protein